jgi:hypothetical protein
VVVAMVQKRQKGSLAPVLAAAASVTTALCLPASWHLPDELVSGGATDAESIVSTGLHQRAPRGSSHGGALGHMPQVLSRRPQQAVFGGGQFPQEGI